MKTCNKCGLEHDEKFHICPNCSIMKSKKEREEKLTLDSYIKQIDECSERLKYFEFRLEEAKKEKAELLRKRYPKVWYYYRKCCKEGCCWKRGYYTGELSIVDNEEIVTITITDSKTLSDKIMLELNVEESYYSL